MYYIFCCATVSINLASLISRRESPLQSCVASVTSTRLYTLNHSGWWSDFSAWSATSDMKPNPAIKSLNSNVLVIASRPSTMDQCDSSATCFSLSSAVKRTGAADMWREQRRVLVRRNRRLGRNISLIFVFFSAPVLCHPIPSFFYTVYIPDQNSSQ